MILVSFALLGAAFITLSYQYTIRETRDSMERNVADVASLTSSARALGIGTQNDVYQLYVANIAHISNAVVIITEADGELVLYTDGSTIPAQSDLSKRYLPRAWWTRSSRTAATRA